MCESVTARLPASRPTKSLTNLISVPASPTPPEPHFPKTASNLQNIQYSNSCFTYHARRFCRPTLRLNPGKKEKRAPDLTALPAPRVRYNPRPQTRRRKLWQNRFVVFAPGPGARSMIYRLVSITITPIASRSVNGS